MEKQDIITAVASQGKGTKFNVTVNRPAHLRAAFKGENVRKESKFELQLAPYANRKPVKDAVAAGEREAPELPGWVERAERLPNGLQFWHGKNGQVYLAMPRFGATAFSKWFVDGKEVRKDDIAEKLLGKEFKKPFDKKAVEAKGQAGFNAIKLENVKAMAWED
jgi:hypothetical protein